MEYSHSSQIPLIALKDRYLSRKSLEFITDLFASLSALGAIPMLLYEIVIMVVFGITGLLLTLSLMPMLIWLFITLIFIVYSEVISNDGEIGFIEALRNLFNPGNSDPQNFSMFCLRDFRSDGF